MIWCRFDLETVGAGFVSAFGAGQGLQAAAKVVVGGQRAGPGVVKTGLDVTGVEAVGAGRDVARLLRGIAAITEVVVGRIVGGRPIVAVHVSAAAAEVAADPFGLGGNGGGEQDGGEGDFGEGFHIFVGLLFVWFNGLHSLHRKRGFPSYNYFQML